jgi:hypothetical protein
MWFVLTAYLAVIQTMYDSLGNKALSNIEWNWQEYLPDWQINFYPGRPGRLAEATNESHIINVWIRKDQTSIMVAGAIAHEFGHAFDWTYMEKNPEMRKEWLKIRHFPSSTKWDPGCDCTDYKFGSGDFAESVAWTLVGPGAGFKGELGKPPRPPNEEEQALIRKWLGIK